MATVNALRCLLIATIFEVSLQQCSDEVKPVDGYFEPCNGGGVVVNVFCDLYEFPPKWINSSYHNERRCVERISMTKFRGWRIDEYTFDFLSDFYSTQELNFSAIFELRIEGNLINSILPGTFDKFLALKTLSLRHNDIWTLKDGTLNSLLMLEIIDLSENHMSSINNNAFSGNIALKEVYISGTHLFSINGLFSQNINLQKLDISRNLQLKLNGASLNSADQLKYLKMNDLSLQDAHLNIFRSFEIEYLNISGNKIHYTFNVFQNLHKLKILDLSRNKILTIKKESFVGMDNTEELYLRSNQIIIIDDSAFSKLKRLKTLDLSGNEIINNHFQNMKSLEVLYLQHNKIEKIYNKSFSRTPNLINLDLSWNDITDIQSYSFTNLQNLEYLNLSSNVLVRIDGCFINMIKLKVLDLSHSYMRKIDRNLLQGLAVLERLHLNNNKFAKLSLDVFSFLPHLRYLDLSDNPLERPVVTLFPGSYNLEYLYLNNLNQSDILKAPSLVVNLLRFSVNHNNITTVPSKIFNNSTHLEYLDLSHNLIQVILEDSFCNLSNLIYLNLNYNKLKNIPPNVFQTTISLRILDLSSNDLDDTIPVNLFRSNGDLDKLNLSSNSLTNFNMSQVSGLKKLKLLDISNNQITHTEDIEATPKLTEIYLERNRWSCMHLFDFLDVLDEKKIDFIITEYNDTKNSYKYHVRQIFCDHKLVNFTGRFFSPAPGNSSNGINELKIIAENLTSTFKNINGMQLVSQKEDLLNILNSLNASINKSFEDLSKNVAAIHTNTFSYVLLFIGLVIIGASSWGMVYYYSKSKTYKEIDQIALL